MKATKNYSQKIMDSNWRLRDIKLEFKAYGVDKGNYVGKITCQNGEYESFSFKITPDMAQPFIDLISSTVIKKASDLGNRLIESLGITDDMEIEDES